MEQKKFLQDGDHFYLVDGHGLVSGPFVAPFVPSKTTDHDIERARKAREWFISYVNESLGYEPKRMKGAMTEQEELRYELARLQEDKASQQRRIKELEAELEKSLSQLKETKWLLRLATADDGTI